MDWRSMEDVFTSGWDEVFLGYVPVEVFPGYVPDPPI